MKRELILTVVALVVISLLSVTTNKTEAGQSNKRAYGEQIFKNSLRAFGELDGVRLTAEQVDYYSNLPTCPNVDIGRAVITDGDWLYTDSTDAIAILFNNAHKQGKKIMDIEAGL